MSLVLAKYFLALGSGRGTASLPPLPVVRINTRHITAQPVPSIPCGRDSTEVPDDTDVSCERCPLCRVHCGDTRNGVCSVEDRSDEMSSTDWKEVERKDQILLRTTIHTQSVKKLIIKKKIFF